MKNFLLHFYILQVTTFNAHKGFKQQPSRLRDIDVKSSGYRIRRHFEQRIQGDQVTP